MEFIIFCDGAVAVHTDQVGGYAVILQYNNKEKEIVGGARNTTNNRMELMGPITAFKAINKITNNAPCQVTIISDSEYVVKGMNTWVTGWQRKGWKTANKKPVKNRDLWIELLDLSKAHSVTWQWTKGHADCEENNRCDQLAVEAIDKIRKKISG